MFDLDRWQEIYATVMKHKLRTALTCFGVFWGIFMLVVMLGASKGFENGVMSTLDIAANSVFVWSQKTSEPYKGLQPGRFIRFKTEDVEALREQIPELEVIAPRNQVGGTLTISRGTKTASFNVFGDYPDFFKVKPMDILQGRFINSKDIYEKRKVIVIGEQVIKELFKEDEKVIGEYIDINGIFFKVVGVFRSKGRGEDIVEDAKTIFMPHSAMQQAFNQGKDIYWFAFLPKKGVPASLVERRVKEVLAERHWVAPTDLKAFGSANVEEQFNKIQGLFQGIAGFSWIVSIGTILAGIIGVSNIMLIVVKERTKEIGVRKALGATPWSIISLVITESVVITAFAGYMGLLLGVGLVEGINSLLKANNAEGEFFANPEVNMSVAIASVVLLVIVGAMAGLIPASKAAKVNPVVALKDE
jgi:putative ABC transport system permease protein